MELNQESRTINASKNAVSAIANKIALLFLTFISRKFFISYIGVEYLGIDGLFANVLTLLSMADLGLGTAINVSLYKPIAENDTYKITALLNYFKILYRFIALGVTVMGIALIPFLKYLVNMDSDIQYLYLYYVVFVAKNTVSYLFIYKSALIRADQKTYLINKVEVVINFVKVVVQILSIIILKSYFIYILADVIAILAQNIIVSSQADKQYSFITDNSKLELSEKKGIFSDVASIFLYKIAWSLLNGTDNILMSIIVGTVYVGLYSNYFIITNNLETFIALLFTSLTASVGNLVATSDENNRYKIFKMMQMVSFWLCGIVCLSILFLMQDFIQLWLGKKFLLDQLTLVAIVLNVFFSTCMRPVWTFREGTGMYKQIRYIMFLTALINLGLSIVLGNFLGISGILFATVISKLLTYFWYEPNILFKKFFKVSSYSYYVEYIKNALVLGICGLLCYIPISHITHISLISWLLKAFICVIIINLVYLIRYYRTPEFLNIKNKVTKIISHKSSYKKSK